MLFEDVYTFMKGVPPFQFLEEEALKTVAGNLSMEFYPKGEVILKQGSALSDSFWIIRSGGVEVSVRSDSGEDVVIDYRGEGETFGLVSLMSGDKQKTTIRTIDQTVCLILDKKELLGLIDSHPAFVEYFLQSHFSKYIDKTYREMHNKSLFYGSSDHLLFTTQVGDIATKEVITATEGTTIQEAAQVMARERISSLVIVNGSGLPAGIITDRDLREKVVAKGRAVGEAVRTIMSPPLIRMDARDYCFEAVLKMIKYNIHHVLVIKDGALKGVITNHDLMLLQGKSPLSFAKDIESQQTIEGLVPVAGKINKVIGLLLKEGAKASNITKIITELNDRLVRKVLEIAERKFGQPPLPYCWMALGSEGRKEQTFKTDQDNAIIYADPPTPAEEEKAKAYFSLFTRFVQEGLVRCGFPLCPADYMASNPEWCRPLGAWKRYFERWIVSPSPEAILRSLVFFDARPLYGEAGLVEELREYRTKMLKGQNIFFAKMAGVITRNRPPLGFIKSFIVEKSGEHKDELNLKINGIGPLVDLVRLFALEAGVPETSTLERIAAMRGGHTLVNELGEELDHAFEFITLLRIHHQMDRLERGQDPDNFINPRKLSNLERKSLKEAFQLISKIQDGIIDHYGPGMVGG
ncbi:MAG: DUF294 nucleotidyltransferase-like domain-containing protein [Nitrospirota bacterium]